VETEVYNRALESLKAGEPVDSVLTRHNVGIGSVSKLENMSKDFFSSSFQNSTQAGFYAGVARNGLIVAGASAIISVIAAVVGLATQNHDTTSLVIITTALSGIIASISGLSALAESHFTEQSIKDQEVVQGLRHAIYNIEHDRKTYIRNPDELLGDTLARS